MLRLRRPRVRGNRVFVGTLLLGTMMALGQALIDDGWENLSCTLLTIVSMIATFSYCFRRNLIDRVPLSTVAVLGFNVTTHSLALVAQTFSGRALIFNLQSPQLTFGYTILSQAVILAAHLAYTHFRSLNAPSDLIARHVLRPLAAFRLQTRGELWLLGIIGFTATAVSRVIYNNDIAYGAIGGKFLQSLTPLVVLPYFIPFRGMFLMRPTRSTFFSTVMLIAYSGLVVVLAVAMNRRTNFALAGYTVLLATLMMIWMKRWQVSARIKLVLLIGSLLSLPLITMAQDLATAMTVSRANRDSVGPTELIALTMKAFNDKPALERERAAAAETLSSGGYGGYSEAYISSEFLQRLTFTKYTDLTMTASRNLSYAQRLRIRDDFKQSLVTILPTPVIDALGLDVDKTYTNYSSGDFYESLASGRQLGSQLTGSSITHFLDLFGMLWPVALAVIAIFAFNMIDCLSLRVHGGVILSPIAFLSLFTISSRALIGDSVRVLIDVNTRGVLLNVFDFVLMAMIARIALGALGGVKNERARMASNAAHQI